MHTSDIDTHHPHRGPRSESSASRAEPQVRPEVEGAHDRTAPLGNPRVPLEDRTRSELYAIAREMQIAGRSRMNREALILSIRGRL